MPNWSAPNCLDAKHSACMLEEHAIGCQPHDIDALIADRPQIGGKFYVAALPGFCARVAVSGVGAGIYSARSCKYLSHTDNSRRHIAPMPAKWRQFVRSWLP